MKTLEKIVIRLNGRLYEVSLDTKTVWAYVSDRDGDIEGHEPVGQIVDVVYDYGQEI